MTGSASPEPRCLFVVSRNHSELSLALSFLRGQEFARRTLMLLPDRLYALHGAVLPVQTRPYSGPDDVGRAMDEHQPDLLFLFSGYLLSLDRLVSVRSLHALLDRLRGRGGRGLTSDPFWGLLPRLTLDQVNRGWLALEEPAWTRWLLLLLVRLRRRVVEAARLDHLVHVYPTSIPEMDDGVTRLAFFNPAAPAVRGKTPPPGGREVDGARRRWLFTLSNLDLHGQVKQLGRRQFTEVLLGLLRYALEVKADPTLIAPPPVVSLLNGVLPSPVEVMAACPFPEFERRLLDAEYVFSWNPMSMSVLPRLISGRPVFFFDRGYYSKAIKPYYATGRDYQLSGWEPTYLDQRQIFSPYVLAHLAKMQKPALGALRERWQSSATPDEVVNRLSR